MLANIVKEKNMERKGKGKKGKKEKDFFSHWLECLQAEKKETILIVFKE